jgi:hypothetical protein
MRSNGDSQAPQNDGNGRLVEVLEALKRDMDARKEENDCEEMLDTDEDDSTYEPEYVDGLRRRCDELERNLEE